MTNKGVTKLIICLAVFALSLSMFFQNWFSLNRPEMMDVASDIFNSGKNILTDILGADEKDTQITEVSGPVEVIKQLFLNRVDSIISGVENVFYLSPQAITQLSKFFSFVTKGTINTLNKIPITNFDPTFFQKTAVLFEIWEYAIYIAAGIALASIIIDRTIGILPYVLLLCTYPVVIFGQLQKYIPLFKITDVLALTPYAIVSIAAAISLLILSIAVRDKKRYALRREAKKMKRWMYL